MCLYSYKDNISHRKSGTFVYLSTHADRQDVDISVTVCLCVFCFVFFCFCVFVCLFVCAITDISAEDKASGVKFCTAVHRSPRKRISHFGETLLFQKLKIGRIGQRAGNAQSTFTAITLWLPNTWMRRS